MNKELISGLVWGAAILVVALASVVAHKLGYMDSEMVTRVVIGFNGLMIAAYGNRIPKAAFVPSAGAAQARRVAGWSMTLSGLIYLGLFAFAPLKVATIGGCVAVFTGIAVTFGYCLSLRPRAKATLS